MSVLYVLGISVFAGVISMLIMHLLEKPTAKETTKIADMIELEKVLLRSLVIHQEQIVYLKQQKERLQEKGAQENLIQRYTEDIELLLERSEDLAKDLQTIWKSRVWEEIEQEYTQVIIGFPNVSFLHERSTKKEYDDVMQELGKYLLLIDKKRESLHDREIVLPAAMYPSSLLEEVLLVQKQTEEKYNQLSKKTDSLLDQLQYVCDAMDVRSIHDENTKREPIEDILRDFSTYLKGEDKGFLENSLDIHINDQIRDMQSISADIQSKIAAEREVEHLLRKKIAQKRNRESN